MNDTIDKLRNNTEDSNDGSKTVRESPVQGKRGKSRSPGISPKHAEIIDTVKRNLTESNRHVVENGHTIALIQQAEDPNASGGDVPIVEQKLTSVDAKMRDPDDILKNNTEDSDNGLKVVVESSVQPKGQPSPEISPKDAEVIHSVVSGSDIDLQRKPAESILNESKEKSKVTNEQVVTAEENDLPISELKLTKSKIKMSDPEIEEDSDDGDGLEIVIESPVPRKRGRRPSPEISPKDAEIISTIASKLDKELDEKAAKANLTESKVKGILKHVVTNEHVVALVRQAEDPNASRSDLPIFEPKLTRAKAKELYPSGSVMPPMHWKPKSKPSKVHALITEELQEDSSGEEYVPGEDEEEEEEEDREGSVHSESEQPSTSKNANCSTQINWSDDGVFKVPQPMTKDEEEANIARRTRSKLCLSSTPLEEITKKFPPDPDIEVELDSNSDVCEMDYDDDWKEFLSKFMKPLDEATKEDEDQDPEYNILAEKEQLDAEELRADRGVKVSKKELNQLIAELFQCETLYTENLNLNAYDIEEAPKSDATKEPNEPSQYTVLTNECSDLSYREAETQEVQSTEELPEEMITQEQKLLLQQQMRQHVQLLTQNFLLLYEHPENADLGLKCKEYLYNLNALSVSNTNSYFAASNLQSAITIAEGWERKFKENGPKVQEVKCHVAKMLHDCNRYREASTKFIPTFHPAVMDTILNSDVFLYPDLLPKMPFKPNKELKLMEYLKPEVELIAIGLEQFIPFVKEDPFYKPSANGEVNLKHVCHYIQRYMLPSKIPYRLYKYIQGHKRPCAEMNPVKYYYENDHAPITLHFVVELNKLGVVPPNQRNIHELPPQWRDYLKSGLARQPRFNGIQSNVTPVQFVNTTLPPGYQLNQGVTNILVPLYPIAISPSPKQLTYKSLINKKRRKFPKSIQKCSVNPSINTKGKRRIQVTQSETGRYFSEFCSQQTASSPKKAKLDEHFKTSSPCKSLTLEAQLRKFKFNSSTLRKAGLLQKMLPSMPCLDTPRRESPEPNDTPFNEEKTNSIFTDYVGIQNMETSSMQNNCDNSEIRLDESTKSEALSNADVKIQEAVKDNLDDINALMVASSTIKPVTTRRKVTSTGEKKKAKQLKEMTANLAMLSPQSEKDMEEKTNRFVQSYYEKLKEQLDLHDYHQLMEVLNNFEPSKDSVSNLYYSVNNILSPKHPDLADEFLSFLTASQAKAVGKLVPYLLLNNMSLFLMKLEMYFKDQPIQVKKIYRALTDLTECLDVNMEKVSNTILPLLKGNKMLIDWFLQIFPKEKPTESMLSGSWETVDIPKDPQPTTEEPYEIVTLPDYDDPYGGPNCICSCHDNPDNDLFKTRARHCSPCGTRFIQGRVYINTGKGLRQVKVSFNNYSGEDPYTRLGCPPIVQSKKRSEASPSKAHTTTKDNHDEVRLSNDSEDDNDCSKKKQSKGKSPRKRKPKPKVEKVKKEKKQHVVKVCKVEKVNVENVELQMNVNERIEEGFQVRCDNKIEQKQDGMEWDCNTSIESMELKLSPEPSAESESGETSQDNLNSDSDSSLDSQANETGNSSGDDSWTKDEDKTILETLQKEGHREETFIHISEMLESRSVAQVKSRFQLLMKLIQEMAAKKV